MLSSLAHVISLLSGLLLINDLEGLLRSTVNHSTAIATISLRFTQIGKINHAVVQLQSWTRLHLVSLGLDVRRSVRVDAKDDCGADSDFTLQVDVATHGLDEDSRVAQADSNARCRVDETDVVIFLLVRFESLEEELLLVARDADSGVLHRGQQQAVLMVILESHNDFAAGLVELDSIVKDVVQDLLEHPHVSDELCRHLRHDHDLVGQLVTLHRDVERFHHIHHV